MLLKKVGLFVEDCFGKSKGKTFNTMYVLHAKSTLKFLLMLKPNADLALRIAALAHDVERAFDDRIVKGPNETYGHFKQRHAKNSAKHIAAFLAKEGADKNLVKKVKALVEKHEVGGSKEANVLKDADSLSFFKTNLGIYVKNRPRETVKNKIKYMYGRLTSKKAKQLAKPFLRKISEFV